MNGSGSTGGIVAPLLKADGFAVLVASVISRARRESIAAECVRTAVTMDGRVDESIGYRSLTAAETGFVEAAREHGALLDPDARGGDLLVVTPTGRLRVLPGALAVPEDGQPLGAVVWPAGRPADVDRRWREERDRAAAVHRELRAWLADRPEAEVREQVERIAYAVTHMAPVLLYVGDATYTNLGRWGALPGNSVRYGSDRCQLTALLKTPVADWSTVDATFVVCLAALLRSGPPVRAEEFNGVQLGPAALETFLRGRIADYRVRSPRRRAGEPLGAWLIRLGAACGAARRAAVAAGDEFYRTINGLSLHKRESAMAPVTLDDVPRPLLALLSARTGCRLTRHSDQRSVSTVFRAFARGIVAEPAPPGFRTAYAEFLHHLLAGIAESTGSDVAMGRGPRSLARLRDLPDAVPGPLRLRTGDFYCCVVASEAFAEEFADDRPGLVRALSAYSARMRFNTWHYLPHALALHDRVPGREDWYFAPVMPDVTAWSDQHHTGHVQFGVRHAIRVPLGIDFDGAHRPGLYDLRLLRCSGEPFTPASLRTAVAAGRVLGALHQEMAAHDVGIDDFGNDWYRAFHGTEEKVAERD
jgi:hypothetical protein